MSFPSHSCMTVGVPTPSGGPTKGQVHKLLPWSRVFLFWSFPLLQSRAWQGLSWSPCFTRSYWLGRGTSPVSASLPTLGRQPVQVLWCALVCLQNIRQSRQPDDPGCLVLVPVSPTRDILLMPGPGHDLHWGLLPGNDLRKTKQWEIQGPSPGSKVEAQQWHVFSGEGPPSSLWCTVLNFPRMTLSSSENCNPRHWRWKNLQSRPYFSVSIIRNP